MISHHAWIVLGNIAIAPLTALAVTITTITAEEIAHGVSTLDAGRAWALLILGWVVGCACIGAHLYLASQW